MWKLTLTEAMKCEFAAVQPPCPKHRLAELESRAEETLGLVPPGEYLELLKVTDGFMLNGVQI